MDFISEISVSTFFKGGIRPTDLSLTSAKSADLHTSKMVLGLLVYAKIIRHLNSRKSYIPIIEFSKISGSTSSHRGKWDSQQISHTLVVDGTICRLTCKMTGF